MRLVAAALLAALAAPSAFASAYWTDWTSAAASSVSGTLSVGSSNVSVVYSGPYSGAQTAGGTNYWLPNVYTSATVPNGPPDSDIIQLSTGGTKTITFSQSVSNPLIGLVSWNGNTVDFGAPINVLSYGQGFWGNGTPIINGDESAIFCMGSIERRPWVVGTGAEERIEPRWVTTLAVAFDHRIIDGEQGSRFLHDVASILREPAVALLF